MFKSLKTILDCLYFLFVFVDYILLEVRWLPVFLLSRRGDLLIEVLEAEPCFFEGLFVETSGVVAPFDSTVAKTRLLFFSLIESRSVLIQEDKFLTFNYEIGLKNIGRMFDFSKVFLYDFLEFDIESLLLCLVELP